MDKDRQGFLAAAERAMAINPQNTNTAGWMALLLGHMRESERAFAIINRAMQLNSHHPGWYHLVVFDVHYQNRHFEEAYRAVKRVNMPEIVWSHLLLAEVCGQLGLAEEARAALQSVYTLVPHFKEHSALREAMERWFWHPSDTDPYIEGFRKAEALAQALDAKDVHQD